MTSPGAEAVLPPNRADEPEGPDGALAVFRNRPFLLLWLSQLFTQIGGNMVLYGLTVIVVEATRSTTANSFLILSFLVPAVLFSAVAGVYVDRFDKRGVLVATNLLRTGLFVLLWIAGANVIVLMLLNMIISTVTVFFAPAEAAMIPQVVPRRQLIAANGIFTLTLNAAFAIGFALLGPIVVNLLGAPRAHPRRGGLLSRGGGLLLDPPALAAGRGRWRRDHRGRRGGDGVHAGPAARGHRVHPPQPQDQLVAAVPRDRGLPRGRARCPGPGVRDGVAPAGAEGLRRGGPAAGLRDRHGHPAAQHPGHLLPRRRLIEVGLVALGILLFLIAAAGPISRFLQNAERAAGLATALADFTSLLAVVVFIALLAGIAYAFVAIQAQTQLQEDIRRTCAGASSGS